MSKVIVRLDPKNVEIFEEATFDFNEDESVLYIRRSQEDSPIAVFKKWMYVRYDDR